LSYKKIALKFLLETTLQSDSSDTLDDLLGFRVQKLWSKEGVGNLFTITGHINGALSLAGLEIN